MFSITNENKTNIFRTCLDIAKTATLAIALTLAALVLPVQEASADCTSVPNPPTDGTVVACGPGVVSGYDGDGYDSQLIVVSSGILAVGTATASTGIDLGPGTGGNANDNIIYVLDSSLGGFDNALIDGTAGDGVLVIGNNSVIGNGGGDTIGGGTIRGTDRGVHVEGTGNTINNVNNGAAGATASGLIAGGVTPNSDGIYIRGGTVGSPNIINNGVLGTGNASIVGNGDDGVDGGGFLTVNNGDGTNASVINGVVDEGISYATGDTLTVNNALGSTIMGGNQGISLDAPGSTANIDNDGTISSTWFSGIRMGDANGGPDVGQTVTLTGGGSVTGGLDGVLMQTNSGTGGSTFTFNGEDGATVTGTLGDGVRATDGDNHTIEIQNGAVLGDLNGIIVSDGLSDGTRHTITVGDGDPAVEASVTGTDEDGINGGDFVDVTVNSDGSVSGGEDGIYLDDDANVTVTSATVTGLDGYGIFADSDATVIVTGETSKVTGSEDGIDVGDGAVVSVTDGDVEGDGGDGIGAGDSADVDVVGATASVIGSDDGIDVGDDAAVTVTAAKVEGEGADGINAGDNFTGGITITADADIDGADDGIQAGSNTDNNGTDNVITVTGSMVHGAGNDGINVGSGLDDSDRINIVIDGGSTVDGGNGGGIDGGSYLDITVDGAGTTVTGNNTNASGDDGQGILADDDNLITVSGGAVVTGFGVDGDGIQAYDHNTILVTGDGTIVTGTLGDGIQVDDDNKIHVTDLAVVNGDPGILADDDNEIIVDGGATVNATNNGIDVDDDNTIIIGAAPSQTSPGVNGGGATGATTGTGFVNVTGSGDGISLTDGDTSSSSVNINDNIVYVGVGGDVRTAAGDGIVVGHAGKVNEDNIITVAGSVRAGDVDNDGVNGAGADWVADATGMELNVQNSDADGNTVTVTGTGLVQAGGTGIAILGDDDFNPLLGDDSVDNDVTIELGGVVQAGLGGAADVHGILVENPESDLHIDGTIDTQSNEDADGIHFSVIHSDSLDGDKPLFAPGGELLGGATESSVTGSGQIFAGRDGIHYDDVSTSGDTTIIIPVPVLGLVTFGPFQELVQSELDIVAGRDGIRVNDGFIVANDGEISAGDDGVQGGSNNFIFNTYEINTVGLTPTGDDGNAPAPGLTGGITSNGIELSGGNNYVVNVGLIDTFLAPTGAGGVADGDGIHIAGDSSTVINAEGIFSGDDGIQVGSGTPIGYLGNDDDVLFFDAPSIMGFLPPFPNPAGDNTVINSGGSLIHANDSGIVAGDYTRITNEADAIIVADADGVAAVDADVLDDNSGITFNADDGATAGIVVEDFNTVVNAGTIVGGPNADGIYAGDDNGDGWGSITNDGGTIDVGLAGISAGSDNDIINTNGGAITGGVDGILLRGDDNDVESHAGSSITGGTGGALNIQGDDNNADIDHDLGSTVGSVGAGILIGSSADDNDVEIDGSVTGDGHGLDIQGDDNNVEITGDLTGVNGDGANISGIDNNVEVDGVITGDPGVVISGDDNNVAGMEIVGALGGVTISGDDNKVETTGGPGSGDGSIQTVAGDGVKISGDDNSVVADDEIITTGGTGVVITGSDNIVSAGEADIGPETPKWFTGLGISGTDGGVAISDGIDNDVSTTGGIFGLGGTGVSITSDDNNVESGGTDVSADTIPNPFIGVELTNVGISGGTDGVNIQADDNNVTTSGFIQGVNGDGVNINGDDNSVEAGEGSNADLQWDDIGIMGQNHGVKIVGNTNDVETSGWIDAFDGEGVDIDGSHNTVDAKGVYSSNDDGVQIRGGSENVVTVGIGGVDAGDDGIQIGAPGGSETASDNTVTVDGIVLALDDGVRIAGDDNRVEINNDDSEALAIESGASAISIDGDTNSVTADGNVAGNVGVNGDDNIVDAGNVTGALAVTGEENNIDLGDISSTASITGDDNDLDAGAITGSLTSGGDSNDADITSAAATSVTGDDNNVDASGALGSLAVTGDDNNVDSASVTGNATVSGDDNSVDTGDIGGLASLTGDDNDLDAGAITGSLTIGGDSNDADITSAAATSVTGDENNVDASGALGSLAIDGDDNNVDSASVTGNATVSGDDNEVDTGDIGGLASLTGDDNDLDAGAITGSLTIGGDSNDADITSAAATSVTGDENNVDASGALGSLAIDGDDNNVDSASVTGNATVSGDDNSVDTGDIGGLASLTGDDNDLDAGAITGSLTIGGDSNDADITSAAATSVTGDDNNVDASGDLAGVSVTGNSNDVDAGSVTGAASLAGNANLLDVDDEITGGLTIVGDTNNANVGDDGASSSIGGALAVTGDQNTVVASADVADDVTIEGEDNNVDVGDIGGLASILGDDNDLDVGAITGTLVITGNLNEAHITSAGATTIGGSNNIVEASGDLAGVAVTGDDNDVDAGSVTGAASLIGDDNSLDSAGAISGSVTVTGNDNDVDSTSIGSFLLVTGDDNNVDTAGGSIGGDATLTGEDNDLNSGNVAGALTIDGDDNDADVGTVGDGIDIDGNINMVTSGTVTVTTAATDGINVDGSDNDVEVTGSVTGTQDGIEVAGSDNTVTATVDVVGGTNGVIISGDDNTVSAGGNVKGLSGNGVQIDGDENDLDANDIYGSAIGADINGDDNEVVASWIWGAAGQGVDVDGDDNVVTVTTKVVAGDDGVNVNGINNTVNLEGVYIEAEGDGVYIADPSTTFTHDSDTSIVAGDDGIEFGWSGNNDTGNELLVWSGSIVADDNGFTANAVEDDDSTTLGNWTIHNSGRIEGDADNSEDGAGILLADDNIIRNSSSGIIAGWNGIEIGDNNLIDNDGTIHGVNTGIIAGSNNTITNSNPITISGVFGHGIEAVDNNLIINESGGTISGGTDGINVQNDNGILNQAGATITGGDDGIEADDNNEIVNEGAIVATSEDAVHVENFNLVVNAAGATITAGDDGIRVQDDNGSFAFHEVDSDGLELNEWILVEDGVFNDGSILADSDGIHGGSRNWIENIGSITAGDNGIEVDGDDNLIISVGSISAVNHGIIVEEGGDDNLILAAGTIGGDTADLLGGGFADVLHEGIELEGSDSDAATGNVIETSAAITTTYEGIDLEHADDNEVFMFGGSINSTNGPGIGLYDSNDNGVVMSYDASITSGGDGIVLDNSDRNSVALEDTALVTATDDGIKIDNGSNGGNNTANAALISVDSDAEIDAGDDGIKLKDDADNWDIVNDGTISGDEDGLDIGWNSNDNYVVNNGSIAGGENGVRIFRNSDDNSIINEGSITGTEDGVNISRNSEENYIYNDGSITGTNGDGVEIDGNDNSVYNDSDGEILGMHHGVYIDGNGNDVTNVGGLISATNSTAGVAIFGDDNDVYNTGTIGSDGYYYDPDYGVWVTGDGNQIVNEDDSADYGSRGSIRGAEAGIGISGTNNIVVNGDGEPGGDIVGENAGIYVGDHSGHDPEENAIFNGTGGLIEVTGGTCTPAQFNADCSESPVAAIDSGESVLGGGSEEDDELLVVNRGTIQGEDEHHEGFIQVDTMTQDVDGNELFDTDEVTPLGPDGTPDFTVTAGAEEGDSDIVADILVPASIQDASRLAVRDGAGHLLLVNLDGGVINGNVEAGAGDDILDMETGSTLNGNADLGMTSGTVNVLNPVEDASDTPEVDESAGGTLFTLDEEAGDESTDLVVLFGEGTGEDRGVFDGDIVEAELLQKIDHGTWDINGNVTVDGVTDYGSVGVDADGDGDTDGSATTIVGIEGTDIWEGRLNVGGTTDEGIQSGAMLTTPVLNVHPGDGDEDGTVGVLGGHGTVVTDPSAGGGNGGVFVSGLSTGQGDFADTDLVGTDPDGGNLWTWETNDLGVDFDDLDDGPRRGIIAPGDADNRIGTLTVEGNVTFDGRATGNLTQHTDTVVGVDLVTQDPVTGADLSDTDGPLGPDGINDFDVEPGAEEGDPDVIVDRFDVVDVETTGREVVLNWGGEFQADLNDSGENDLLNVVASGNNTAVTTVVSDTTGLGDVAIDEITQDAEGLETAAEADGIQDFDIVDDVSVPRFDTDVPGAGGPDGVADSVTQVAGTIPDGQVTLGGRLDVILDAEFVDLTTNGAPAEILDPDNTGCDNAPDGTPNCYIPNPAVGTPDGIADVDASGNNIYNADFSVKGEIYDIIIAEGGVVGEFNEYGFDSGANDGAIVVNEDGTRVQLFKGFLQYLPDRVRIISIPDFGPMGEHANQTAFGNYLDSLTQYGLNQDSLHETLSYLGIHQMEFGNGSYLDVVNRLTPEFYNAYNEVGISLAANAAGQVSNRALQARSGNRTALMVQGYSVDMTAGQSGDQNKAAFWVGGNWSNSEVESDAGFMEYEFDSLVGYLGFDYLITDSLLLGIMGSFGNTDVDYASSSASRGDVDSWSVGGYLSYFGDNGLFANFGGGVGDLSIESARDVSFSSMAGNISAVASADYDGDYTYFFGEAGYAFELSEDGILVTPEIGLMYTKVKQDAFTESGAGVFNLAVDEQSHKSVRGTLQVRLSKTYETRKSGIVVPYIRAGVAKEFEDDLRAITSRFVGDSGSFVTLGEVPRETTAIFGAGVATMFNDVWSIHFDYSGELGGNYKNHNISGSVRIRF